MAEPSSIDVPEAEVIPRRRLSVVWLIPFVAALIAGWLTYRTLSDRGPAITITFRTAEGIEAGKTKVKYRDLEMGVVESIELAPNLSHVVVTARMAKGTERFLREKTRFWVVRANVTAGGVTGLGTLFSGAYVGMDPVEEGAQRWEFKGLDTAPLVTSGDPGRRFVLRAPSQGSLTVGSPIYYRKVEVGDVVRTELDPSGEFVNIDIYVYEPHHERVRENSRFWNVSGVEVSLDADGLRVDTESLVSMLIGGAAFEEPAFNPGPPAKEGTVFDLYPNRNMTSAPVYAVKQRYLLYVSGSVKGLGPGSPVEFRGIRIGQVVDVSLEYDPDEHDFRTPVVIEIEPERFSKSSDNPVQSVGAMKALVERGLRAQLKTANLLTGQQVVDLDIHPDASPVQIVTRGRYPELPTIPTPLEELSSSLTRLVARLERLPLEQMGDDLRASAEALRETLAETKQLAARINADVVPAASRAMTEAEKSLAAIHALVNPNSTVSRELKRLLLELADAAKSIRRLADHLERNPEDMLRGRRGE